MINGNGLEQASNLGFKRSGIKGRDWNFQIWVSKKLKSVFALAKMIPSQLGCYIFVMPNFSNPRNYK